MLPTRHIKQFKPVQLRREQEPRAYCSIIYTVILGKTPQKLVQSISKAVGKKLLMHIVANILKEEEKNPYSPSVSDTVFKVGPKFEMIASVTLNIDNCSHDVETHELYIEDRKSQNCPPMFGAICCRLAALPYW